MFTISNNGIITISRGDSFEFAQFINQGTKVAPMRYELTENDTLYFAVMEPNQSFENAKLKKVYTSEDPKNDFGDTLIRFSPEDTAGFEPGLYYYEVKLRTVKDTEEDVNTVMVKTIFNVID